MQLYQHYNTGDDDDREAYENDWLAQTFTTETIHLIAKVKLKLFRTGSPGTILVSIKATTDGKPTGADLCSGEIEGNTITEDPGGEWYEIPLGDGFTFARDTKYAIVVKAVDGDVANRVSWRSDKTEPGYTRGEYNISSNSGETWDSFPAVDCMFEEWGVGEPAPSTITWGQLSKSQISAETIEEAIARLIDAHLADAGAHADAGESLDVHKEQSVVDHPIGSVVGDKFTNKEFTFTFPFESLDKFTESAAGVSSDIGGFKLDTGAIIDTERYLFASAQYSEIHYYPDRDTTFQILAALYANTNQIAYMVAGGINIHGEPPGIGFKIVNGTLYAIEIVWGEEATEEYTAEIAGINVQQYHLYRVQVVASENKAYFYVDGVLKTTLILHENADVGLCAFSVSIENTAAEQKILWAGGIYLSINPL